MIVPDSFVFHTYSYTKLAGWSVDLVTKGFQVLCQLIQDLECDKVSDSSSIRPDEVIPFADQLDIFNSYTPWQRIRMLIASIPLVDVLFTLLCSSYKKVCTYVFRVCIFCCLLLLQGCVVVNCHYKYVLLLFIVTTSMCCCCLLSLQVCVFCFL